jgi:hypothetical protein
MNDVVNLNNFLQPDANQLDIYQTLFNFLVCLLMAFVLRRFYINRSYSLSSKLHIGAILPILSGVVFTVIVVVKSSLALSLGLVGALSIVRFRTPIKEPEELVYLFLAIAIGLGYGAGHTLLTTVLVMIILGVTFIWLSNRNTAKNSEYNLVLNWKSPELKFEVLSDKIKSSVESMSLIRLERGPNGNTAVLLVAPAQDMHIDNFVADLQASDPQLNVTFFEAKSNW